jgi:hypothetical protein
MLVASPRVAIAQFDFGCGWRAKSPRRLVLLAIITRMSAE